MIHSPLVTSSFLCGEAIAPGTPVSTRNTFEICLVVCLLPIGSMYGIYGNMDPINIPPMLAYIYTSTMDPMGYGSEDFPNNKWDSNGDRNG